MKSKIIGRHIISNPGICHGKPVFRGTRILVSDVMGQVASGMDWETIIEEWNNNISTDAIQEAIVVASKAFMEHAEEYVVESSTV